jgi:hypothetical protein
MHAHRHFCCFCVTKNIFQNQVNHPSCHRSTRDFTVKPLINTQLKAEATTTQRGGHAWEINVTDFILISFNEFELSAQGYKAILLRLKSKLPIHAMTGDVPSASPPLLDVESGAIEEILKQEGMVDCIILDDTECFSDFSDNMHIQQGIEIRNFQHNYNSGKSSYQQPNEISDHKEEKEDIIISQLLTPVQQRHVESEAIDKVLATIDSIETAQKSKGFRQSYFTLGLVNCLLVAYAFGAAPQHFWIIYIAECVYFIPCKFRNMWRAKPLCEALYYLDFCWTMNFLGVISVILVLVASMVDGGFDLTQAFRKNLYMATFGIACGPLLGATALLPFVAFLFHDVNTMTNLIIHMMPPMLMFTLFWHADAVQEVYGEIFDLSYINNITYFPVSVNDDGSITSQWWAMFWPPRGAGSIAGNSFLVYLIWFVPYVMWMLVIGLNLPNKNKRAAPKYDTVFHSLWRAGPCEAFGTALWKRPVEFSRQQMKADDYEVRDFLAYMCFHAVMITGSIVVLGLLCFVSIWTHRIMILGVVAVCAHRGSVRYTYYVTEMYGRNVRKQLMALQKKQTNEIV